MQTLKKKNKRFFINHLLMKNNLSFEIKKSYNYNKTNLFIPNHQKNTLQN